MFSFSILIGIFFLFSLDSKAVYDPTICDNGDNTAWEGPLIAWVPEIPGSVLGCNDSDCTASIVYFKRVTSWGVEFQLASITFSNTCGSGCSNNAYITGLWIMIIKNYLLLNINEINDCYYNFVYRLATCWEHSSSPVFSNKYSACGGDCCTSTYQICLREDANGKLYYEFNKTGGEDRNTFECTTPCIFTNCASVLPLYIELPAKKENGTDFIVFPKLSVNSDVVLQDIDIKPNPTKGIVNITFKVTLPGTYNIKIFDNIGNEMFTNNINIGSDLLYEFDLKANNYPSGNYNVVLSNPTGIILNKRFIKIK
jgi:hypothetical protein